MHKGESKQIIAKQTSSAPKLIPKPIVAKKPLHKRKRGGSKKGISHVFHTWKWRHRRAKEYQEIPKGKKIIWLMKNNISRANIARWQRHLEEHEFDPHRLLKLQTHSAENRKRKFLETEIKLYNWYQTRREQGLRVTKDMMMRQMERMLMEDDQGDVNLIQKKVGRKWLSSFMKENKISIQRRTNKKAKSIYQKLHKVSNYHTFVVYQMANPNNDYPVWKNKKLQAVDFGDSSSEENEEESDSEDTEFETE
jgi:hypothetical protein